MDGKLRSDASLAGDSDECRLYILGDLTFSFESDLRQLLHVKGNAVLQGFFKQVARALRHEIANLPLVEQEWLPSFTDLIDLLASCDAAGGTSAVRLALICVYQIGRILKHFMEGPSEYLTWTNTYLIGLCAGSFATVAASTSQTITDLVPAGITSVMIAFRTGMASMRLQRQIEACTDKLSRSWSASLNLTQEEAKKLVENFNNQNSSSNYSSLYIGTVSVGNVVVNGPAKRLEQFLASTTSRAHVLPIDTPFHAAHLFDQSIADAILSDLSTEDFSSRLQRIPIISPSSGMIIQNEHFASLLRIAIIDTLVQQVRLDKVIASLGEYLRSSSLVSRCKILPSAFGGASFFAARLQKLTEMSMSVNDALNDDLLNHKTLPSASLEHSKIAIVGFSGRFPEANSPEAFWELLREGRDVHRTIPPDRFDWEAHFDHTGKKKNTSRVKHGCFVNEPGLFDARFFNLSPREAENTDPAQRLALMATYEAIEMAGLVPNRTASTQQDRIGVIFGVTSDDWREVNSGQNIDTYFIPGGNRAFVPGRISYFFGFSGPSLSIDTACSSSFASIQTACSQLWRGDCDTVIAGGTNILTNPDNFAGLDKGHFLSTTGNCHAFDDEASGYCRADAVGVVILKRLEDAELDNDPVFGVISSTSTNHCAHAVSITRPHEGDQVSLFRRMIRHANINPLDVSHIEMHGTGTQAGDATEMKSVLSVFAPGFERAPHRPLHIGSVKANVGHSESASGVTSLVKVLMMMQKDEVPPHCGIKTRINHNYPLDLAARNVKIPLAPAPWRRADTIGGKRIAFLNNFSAAGGNTAVLLEDAPASFSRPLQVADPRTVHLVAVTGKTLKALKGNLQSLSRYVEEHPEVSLSAISYTSTARRMHHRYRAIYAESQIDSLGLVLSRELKNIELNPLPPISRSSRIVFVFTGQGSMYAGLGRQLFASVSQFKADILQYDAIAQKHSFPSFLPALLDSLLDIENIDVIVNHLATTCVQMALSRLWNAWGINPTVITGHSLGEYAALFAAGVLSASDTIYLVGARATLLTQHCEKYSHGMLVVKAQVHDVRPQLLRSQSPSEVACINSPTNTVVSGLREDIQRLREDFHDFGHECVPLDLPYAFHSVQVDIVARRLAELASNVHFNPPSVPYLSPLLGAPITGSSALDASYLSRACRDVVNFQEALESGLRAGLVDKSTIWLEIGPHPLCSGMIKSTLGSHTVTAPSLRKAVDPWKTIASSIKVLYEGGADIVWNEYHRGFAAFQRCLTLPAYDWDLKNYWIQYRENFCLTKGDPPVLASPTSVTNEKPPPPTSISASVQAILEEEHGQDVSAVLVESDIDSTALAAILQGHKVNGVALCPSSLYADQALTIAEYMVSRLSNGATTTGLDCCDMKVDRPLTASSKSSSRKLRIAATATWSKATISLRYYSMDEATNTKTDHATCTVRVSNDHEWSKEWKRNAYLIRGRIASLMLSVEAGSAHKMKRGMVYRLFGALVDYNTDYQGMQEVILDSHELEATALVKFQCDANGFKSNPCWIDSLGHIAGFIMNGNDHLYSEDQVFINHGWDRMRSVKPFAHSVSYRTYNKMQSVGNNTFAGDTYVLEDGEIIAVFEGVKFQGVPRKVLNQLLPLNTIVQKQVATVSPSRTYKPAMSKTPATLSASATNTQTPSYAPSIVVKKASQPLLTADCLMAIVAEELGIPVQELSADAVLTDFGMDSLLSLTVTSRIKEELGPEIPSSAFVEHSTIEEFCQRFGTPPTATPMFKSGIQTPISDQLTEENSEAETDATSIVAKYPDDLVNIVRSTLCHMTGLSTEELKDSTMLVEVGIDSLLALDVTAKLSQELEIDISSDLIAGNGTVASLESALMSLKYPLDAQRPPNMDSKVSSNVMGEQDHGLSSEPTAKSVCLQNSSHSHPKTLFLFPDGSGSAASYATIPRISPDLVVYGLSCPWMKTPEELKCSLEHYASKFVEEVLRIQAHGPYYFGGWSAGGILAYEAAQQMTRSGEVVEKLILIDSPNPIGLQNPPKRMYDFLDNLNFFGTAGKAPPRWLRPHFDAFIHMLDTYQIEPFCGPEPCVHIVYAKDGICKDPSIPRPEIRPDDPREMLWLLNDRTDFSAAGWKNLFKSCFFTISTIEGVNHLTMLQPGRGMQDLHQFLQQCMT